jgi:predicted aspartyl protease
MSEGVHFRLAGGQNPLILVPAQVNGRGPYQFILDTGASHCLVSQGLSATLGVQPDEERDATGAGGRVKLALGHVSSLAVGSVQQGNVRVAITDQLELIGAAIQTHVDGGLGFSFLKDFVVMIDYRERVLRLIPPAEGRVDDAQGRGLIPLKLASPSKPLVLVPALVNDQGPFQFAVDTGASRTMLSSELAARLAIETTDDGPVTGGGGQIKMLAGSVRSLVVGEAIVRDLAIGAGDFIGMLSVAVGAKLDGIIGYNFLSQFMVTIDYPRSALKLAPAGGDIA